MLFYDSVLKLLSASLTNDDNVALSEEIGLHQQLIAIFEYQDENSLRYKLLLQCMDTMASCQRNGRKMADYFMENVNLTKLKERVR